MNAAVSTETQLTVRLTSLPRYSFVSSKVLYNVKNCLVSLWVPATVKWTLDILIDDSRNYHLVYLCLDLCNFVTLVCITGASLFMRRGRGRGDSRKARKAKISPFYRLPRRLFNEPRSALASHALRGYKKAYAGRRSNGCVELDVCHDGDANENVTQKLTNLTF